MDTIPSEWRVQNSELFREILSIIRRCDSEYGKIFDTEGAELIMGRIEKLIQQGEELKK